MEAVAARPGNQYKWQESRRRPDITFAITPAQGFGPDGTYTLWLPESVPKKRWRFKDGRPVEGELIGPMADPELRKLRDEVIRSFGPGRLQNLITVDGVFVDYAARMLGAVYKLTDEELELMLSGDRWHKAILNHILGGDELVEKLADINPLLGLLAAPPDAPKPLPPPDPLPDQNPPGWFGRLKAIFHWPRPVKW